MARRCDGENSDAVAVFVESEKTHERKVRNSESVQGVWRPSSFTRLNFQVSDHEFLAIVGPSGCGKTTLLRTIAGIETPDEGQVIIDGRRITKPGADRGFVFQQDRFCPGARFGKIWCLDWKSMAD